MLNNRPFTRFFGRALFWLTLVSTFTRPGFAHEQTLETWNDPTTQLVKQRVNSVPQGGERAYITEHLLNTHAELESRDVSHLSDDQFKKRQAALDFLYEYAQRAVYPKNRHFPGERVPYFVDQEGVHCAFGYMVARSGGQDFVNYVAKHANNGYVYEMVRGEFGSTLRENLVAWLKEYGFTVEEAALIQPTYGGDWGDVSPPSYPTPSPDPTPWPYPTPAPKPRPTPAPTPTPWPPTYYPYPYPYPVYPWFPYFPNPFSSK